VAGAWGWQPYHLHESIVLKSESLNLPEPSGPVKACNGMAFTYVIGDWLPIDFLHLWTRGHKKQFIIEFSVPFFQDMGLCERAIAFRRSDAKWCSYLQAKNIQALEAENIASLRKFGILLLIIAASYQKNEILRYSAAKSSKFVQRRFVITQCLLNYSLR
jgi:hypothetical protein